MLIWERNLAGQEQYLFEVQWRARSLGNEVKLRDFVTESLKFTQSIQQPRRPPKANIGRAWQDVAVKNPNPMHQYTDWFYVLKYNCQNKLQTTEQCCNEGLIRELPPPSAASHFPVSILCMHFCCWFGNWIRHYFTDVLQSVLVDRKASGDELLQATWASQSDHWCTWSLERVTSWGAWKSCSLLRRSVP